MKHLDLFSGIGGFALAASWVWGQDLEIVSFCEKDEFCQKVLAKHWPNVPCVSDIHDLRGDEFGTVDLLTAGFPCQPASIAGKRNGIKDDRWLWPETLRLIQENNPYWLIVENVAGLSSMVFQQEKPQVESQITARREACDVYEALYTRQETMLLENVCQDIEKAGYEIETFIIPACAVDAPHRRDRVWIVGNAKRSGLERESWRRSGAESQNGYMEVEKGTSNSERQQEQSEFPATERHNGWQSESCVGRVAHGIPRRVDRLRGLGNAIVPQVAAVIMAGIQEVERQEKLVRS